MHHAIWKKFRKCLYRSRKGQKGTENLRTRIHKCKLSLPLQASRRFYFDSGLNRGWGGCSTIANIFQKIFTTQHFEVFLYSSWPLRSLRRVHGPLFRHIHFSNQRWLSFLDQKIASVWEIKNRIEIVIIYYSLTECGNISSVPDPWKKLAILLCYFYT